jgi:hypothetical protein
MSSASSRVFATPELLEAILIQLTPLNHLLHAQLISRTFHTVIANSPKLQQLLFFRTNTSRNPKDWSINPLLRQHFLPWSAPASGRFDSRDYDVLRRMDWTKSPATCDAFLRPEASWRNMLLMQPPPKSLKVVMWMHGQGGDSESIADVSFADKPAQGVTMGRVYDITESWLRDADDSYPAFGIDIEDGEMGPQMTLYFRMTVQCCVDEGDEFGMSLKSQGQEMTWHQLEKKEEEMYEDAFGSTRLTMEWKTGLTEERGGVGQEEWEEWIKQDLGDRGDS